MAIFGFAKLIKEKLFFILIITLLCGVGAAVASIWLIPAQYKANVTLLTVGDPNTGSEYMYDKLKSGLELKKDFKELIKTAGVINRVRNELASEIPALVNTSNDDMVKRISFDTSIDTRVFTISYTDASPQTAQKVANKLAEVLKDRIIILMKSDTLAIVDPAETPMKKATPSIYENIAVAMLFGLFGTAFLIILADYFKNINYKSLTTA